MVKHVNFLLYEVYPAEFILGKGTTHDNHVNIQPFIHQTMPPNNVLRRK